MWLFPSLLKVGSVGFLIICISIWSLYHWGTPRCSLVEQFEFFLRSVRLSCRPVERWEQHIVEQTVLFQLHWLPVRFRSLYMILFHTVRVLSGTAPVYLSDMIEIYIYQWECSDLSPIHFWGYQEAIQQCTETDISEHLLPGCGTSCQTT